MTDSDEVILTARELKLFGYRCYDYGKNDAWKNDITELIEHEVKKYKRRTGKVKRK